MSITLITTAYIIYLPIVITLTWYVAHTLFANAKVFMLDIFNGKEAIAMSTNKLRTPDLSQTKMLLIHRLI
jgi:hypothetical protein